MKKQLLLFLLFISLGASVSPVYSDNGPVDIHPVVPGGGNSQPRLPVLIPEVTLDDHTLYLGTAFSDDIDVQLVSIDEVTGNETVVYSTVLYAGDQTVVFPSTLSGTYELRLIVDWYYLAGEVEL